MSDQPATGQEPIASPESAASADVIRATEPIGAPESAAPEVAVPDAAAATTAASATTIEQPADAPPADASPAAAPPVVPARRTRTLAFAFIRRTLRFAVAVGLLGLGAVIGWQAHTANLPAPAIVADPAVAGVAAPDGVVELANAIAADDADAIRSALHQEMFARFTSEMERFGIATIDSVDTLATYADGPRTATALILHGSTTERNPFTINLVVVTQDGQIVRLR